jgi:sulfide:quinone oxidoreductase
MRRYALSRLERKNVKVRLGRVIRVHADEQRVVLGDGESVGYDALLVAVGGRTRPIEHGLTFAGPDQAEMMHGLVTDMEGGQLKTFAFVAPEAATWTLPLYELALQTAERAYDMCLKDVQITFASHESAPLEVFGQVASDRVADLLEKADIRFQSAGVVPGADRVITLPAPIGHPLDGLPGDEDQFVPVDGHCQVAGVDHIWAAGDCTSYSPCQGGLATQQADAAVESILAAAGLGGEPVPYEPVLRAILIAGRHSYYLRRRLDGRDPGTISDRAIWWPPTKIAGRYLAPYLDAIDFKAAKPKTERELDAAGRVARMHAAAATTSPGWTA